MSENQADRLTRQDELDLEAYRTLGANIEADAHSARAFERIVFPLIAAAPIVSTKFSQFGVEAIIGGASLIVIWFFRSMRNEKKGKG